MKNVLAVFMLMCLLAAFACQKSIHWDIASEGSLVKDSNNNCLPVLINGNYIEDSLLNNNNYITIDVDVTSAGSYSIYTDSINGYQFKASGNFNTTGTQHVKLICSGKPLAADTDYFSIHYNTSICQASVVVKSNAIPQAVYSLQGAPSNCLNDSIIGTYRKGVTLDTSNKATISVNVISAGRYSITTNIVNGYLFKADGVFATAGVQTITIYPQGAPINAGTDVFTVKADSSSSCNLTVKVKTDEATFTLQGLPGKCMNDSAVGTYVKGIYLDTFSKVSIEVNVSLTGTYNIKTDLVNGYMFLGAGILTTTGVQIITLYAQGTPSNGGIDIFNLVAGASSCNFEVTVLTDIISADGNDYFPITQGSYWVYADFFSPGNIITRSIIKDTIIDSLKYSIMKAIDSYGTISQSYYRKDLSYYLEYANNDKYTGAFHYAQPNYTDLLFLKNDVQNNQYWETPEFQGVTSFNQVIVLKYGYKCLKTNAVATVNGKAFANVCIIEMRPQIHSLRNPWSYTNEVYTYYYAKGIGLIYYYAINNFNYKSAEWQITTWQVN